MPRTKARNSQQKRQRKASDGGCEEKIKEIERITMEIENKSMIKWLKRKEHISELFDSYRSRLGEKLKYTMDELMHGKSKELSQSMTTNISESSKFDDGYVTEASGRSSKPKRPIGPLASSALAKSRRRSKSANATTNTSTRSSCRNISRTAMRSVTNTNQRESRSRFRTPVNRLQTMSADRNIAPVTPKIQMNTPFSMLRYPKIGETIISMDGSPIIANGGAMQNTANINIPMSNGIFSMNPTPFSEVDSNIVSHIDSATITQLKQLQDNLAHVMNAVSKWSKK